MLAAMFLVAATQVTTPQLAIVQSSHSAVATHDMSPHKRHLLHLAHLRYLHWQHELEEMHDRQAVAHPAVIAASSHVSPGVFSCHALQALWDAAGGNPGVAFLASEIAMAESGGRSNATGPYGERGLWQISTDHGSLSTYDPFGNARAAISISRDGRNWLPWTTYRTGAYVGRCLPARLPAAATATASRRFAP